MHLANGAMFYVHAPAGKVAFITTGDCLDIKGFPLQEWPGMVYRTRATH